MVCGEDRKGPSLCTGWCSKNQRDVGETGSAVCVSEVTGVIKNSSADAGHRVQYLGLEDPLEMEMATHSSILAWEIL